VNGKWQMIAKIKQLIADLNEKHLKINFSLIGTHLA
jgi:hypothetical protein